MLLHTRHPLRAWSLASFVAVLLCACRSTAPTPTPIPTATSPVQAAVSAAAAVQAFYVGLAALQVGDFERAELRLREVTVLAPDEPAAWANLGLLSLRRGDHAAALEAVARAQALDPSWAPAAYLGGAIAMAADHPERAVTLLRQATLAEPGNLAARHLLASAQEASGAALSDTALTRLSLADDAPDNIAANLAAVRATAAAGDSAGAMRSARRVVELAEGWPEHLIPLTEQLAEAAESGDTPLTMDRATLLITAAAAAPGYRADLRALEPSPGEIVYPAGVPARLPAPSDEPAPPDLATTFDPAATELGDEAWPWAGKVVDPVSGVPRLMAANGNQVLLVGPGRAAVQFPGGPESTDPDPDGVLVADVDGDFALDLVLAGAGGFRIFKSTIDGEFEDVTPTGLTPDITDVPLGAVWAADVEADGDLDLVVAPTNGAPLVLRNNGDGSFAMTAPFDGPVGALNLVWADLDGDALPEAVFLGPDGEIVPYANVRGGRFSELPTPSLPPAAGIAVAELTGDSVLDVVVFSRDGGLRALTMNTFGDSSSGRESGWEVSDLASWPGWGDDNRKVRLLAADLDNNGATDLVVSDAHEGRIWLGGADGFSALPLGVSLGGVTTAADFSGDGRLDLVAVDESRRVRLLEGRGGHDYHWKIFRPRARPLTGDGRINSFGLGGQLEVRSGRLVQTALISGPVLHFGLGDYAAVEVARVTWPNGTIQAEFDQPADALDVAPTTFEQRLEGSCPYVFAVGPEGTKFVTDFLWRSPLGMRVNAQETAGIETTEDWIRIPGSALSEQGGSYEIRITADLWEAHFFDAVSLIVVDHPIGSTAWVDERFAVPAPPLTVTLTTATTPLEAWDDLGFNVSDVVAERDGIFLDSFGRGRLQGVTRDHFVEARLGDAVRAPGEVVLVANGWIQPTDSSLNVALAQGTGPAPDSLRIEVPGEDGSFLPVATGLGFPEGKNKTVILHLDDLLAPRNSDGLFPPSGPGLRPSRIRLATNLEVYWDSLGWAEVWSGAGPLLQRLQPDSAVLRYRGFSGKSSDGPSAPEIPIYERLTGTVQRRHDLEGFYTRFGDVRELLETVDDRPVIMNAGDEMVLRFRAPPPPAGGWERDFVLAGDGWVKDGNYNTQHSRTVLPMPAHGVPYPAFASPLLADDPVAQAHLDDWSEFHTRYVGTEPVREALRRSLP